jgi:formyltetrahydrofolate deformylase
MRQTPTSDYVLTLSCPDRPGIVAAVSQFVTERNCSIVESEQYGDRESGVFYMRVQFEPTGDEQLPSLQAAFGDVATPFAMSWRLTDAARKQRVLIMVSKFGHCLNDLLFKTSTGWLNIDIPVIVSNHPDLGTMADNYDIPFRHVPVDADHKPEAEAELLRLVDEFDIDLVVLARYMQILSTDLCKQLEGRAINIHHSMLPSFKGARPYQQAHDRGVKLIGATAHYVTADLDEGQIIEQADVRVDHAMTTAQVTALGRDTECLALARAVHWHTENRVLLDGHRTVVFK